MSVERRIKQATTRLVLAVAFSFAPDSKAHNNRADIDIDPSGMNGGRTSDNPCQIEGFIKNDQVGEGVVSSTYLDLNGTPFSPPPSDAIFAEPIGNALADGTITRVPSIINLNTVTDYVFCGYEIPGATETTAKPGKYSDANMRPALQDGDGEFDPEAVVAQLAGEVGDNFNLDPKLVEVLQEDPEVARMLGMLDIQNPQQIAEVFPSSELEFKNRLFLIIEEGGVHRWVGFDRTQEESDLVYHEVDPQNLDGFFGIQTGILVQEGTNVRPVPGTTEAPISTVNPGDPVLPIGEVVEEDGYEWLPIVLPDEREGFIADVNKDGIFGTEARILGPDALLSPEAFLASYEWREGDEVTLSRTGFGTPDQVSKYWQMTISRDGRVYEGLPVTEQFYSGRVRPLGMEILNFPDYDSYRIQGVYLGQEILQVRIGENEGNENEESSIGLHTAIIAIPSDHGGTVIIRAVAPHSMGFSIGGSQVDLIPTTEVFNQIGEIIRPGAQVQIEVAQENDHSSLDLDAIWFELKGVKCEEYPDCYTRKYTLNPSNLTVPSIVYGLWETGNLDESGVIRENGIILTGSVTQLIVTRPLGTVR